MIKSIVAFFAYFDARLNLTVQLIVKTELGCNENSWKLFFFVCLLAFFPCLCHIKAQNAL